MAVDQDAIDLFQPQIDALADRISVLESLHQAPAAFSDGSLFDDGAGWV